MTSKYYEYIYNDTIVTSKVIKHSGTFIVVPPSWAYKECYIYYPDFYIEKKQTKKTKYNYTFVPVASLYLDQYLLARLKQ